MQVVLADDARFILQADESGVGDCHRGVIKVLADIGRDTATAWFADELAAMATATARPGRETVLLERSAPAGYMAPLCRRDEAETYRVVEGEVSFFVDGDVVLAGPGNVVVVPAGAPHTFRAESDGARWVVLTRVSSLERFLDFGRAVAAPLASTMARWPSPEELATLASIAAANDIELLGPPGALPGGGQQV